MENKKLEDFRKEHIVNKTNTENSNVHMYIYLDKLKQAAKNI